MTYAERQPPGQEWQQIDDRHLPRQDGTLEMSAWRSGPIVVISAVNMAELPDKSGVGPQWMISITARGKRAKPHHIRRALRAFKMEGAEEDNHHPGNVRSFWLPLDPRHRVECECKEEEATITEPDGYKWTNPHDGACRGCEYESMFGKPCPLHSEAAIP
jgi:hypothetical protein